MGHSTHNKLVEYDYTTTTDKTHNQNRDNADNEWKIGKECMCVCVVVFRVREKVCVYERKACVYKSHYTQSGLL